MNQEVKGRADYYAPGDWNAICYQCGSKFKASTLKRYWQGFYVCSKHWEPRHSQDFVRGIPDEMVAPWVQAPPADTFIELCGPNDISAVIGYGVIGCMIIGYRHPAFDPNVYNNSTEGTY